LAFFISRVKTVFVGRKDAQNVQKHKEYFFNRGLHGFRRFLSHKDAQKVQKLT
jgi:hypothetical protein